MTYGWRGEAQAPRCETDEAHHAEVDSKVKPAPRGDLLLCLAGIEGCVEVPVRRGPLELGVGRRRLARAVDAKEGATRGDEGLVGANYRFAQVSFRLRVARS